MEGDANVDKDMGSNVNAAISQLQTAKTSVYR